MKNTTADTNSICSLLDDDTAKDLLLNDLYATQNQNNKPANHFYNKHKTTQNNTKNHQNTTQNTKRFDIYTKHNAETIQNTKLLQPPAPKVNKIT